MSAGRVRTKLCGITSVHDAELALAYGADALGLNFVPQSRRAIDRATARAIVQAVGKRALIVGVVRDLEAAALNDLRTDVGLGCIQLHGDESPALLAAMLPHAYKAIPIRFPSDVELARSFGGEYILLDAPPGAHGEVGGTGNSWPYALARPLANERRVTLAGGLHAGNVEAAIAAVEPWCVDVASGIEEPNAVHGRKSESRVREFIEAVGRANRRREPESPAQKRARPG